MATWLRPFGRIVPKRTFVSKAATKNDSDKLLYDKSKSTKSTLENGLNLVTRENNSPLANLAVVVKVGPRNEAYDQLGVTHCLRSFSGLDTENFSTFRIIRSLQLHGATFNVTSSREHLTYSAQCIRDHVPLVSEILHEIAFQSAFKHWQILDFYPKLKTDLEVHNKNPLSVLIDRLHSVSFKGGLNNSLYTLEDNIGKHTTDLIDDFVCQHFTPQNCVFVGQGVEHEVLSQYLGEKNLPPNPAGSPTVTPSKFRSGEVRIDRDLHFTHTIIASEGVSSKNKKEVIAQALLQQVLGVKSQMQHGKGEFSRLTKAATKVATGPFSVQAFGQNYSDTGLFGFVASTTPKDSGAILKECVAQMKAVLKAPVADEDLKIAKKRLKNFVLANAENLESNTEELALRALSTDGLECTLLADIDSVSASDVSAVAAKLCKTKPSLATIGNLGHTPFVEELV